MQKVVDGSGTVMIISNPLLLLALFHDSSLLAHICNGCCNVVISTSLAHRNISSPRRLSPRVAFGSDWTFYLLIPPCMLRMRNFPPLGSRSNPATRLSSFPLFTSPHQWIRKYIFLGQDITFQPVITSAKYANLLPACVNDRASYLLFIQSAKALT
jgi:hypothetical protein